MAPSNYFGSAFPETLQNNQRPVGSLDAKRITTLPVTQQNEIVPVTYLSAKQNEIVPVTYQSAIVPIKKQEEASAIVPIKIQAEPSDIVVYEPEEEHTFLGDTWQGVVKPVGIGIASPVVGAGAMVGGAVVGAGVFVGSCAYGLFSTARGIVGIVPIGIDYGVKPVANLIDRGVHGVDNTMDQALDSPVPVPSLPSWPDSTPVIEEFSPETPSRRDYFSSPSQSTNVVSATPIPLSTPYARPSTMVPSPTMPYLQGSLPGSRREVGRYIVST